MLLIDAVFINYAGGKILLDYLIENVRNTGIDVVYLLDARIKGRHPATGTASKVYYCSGNILARHLFYLRHRRDYQKVIAFGNVPPNIKLRAQVYTYFHQLLFLDLPASLSMRERGLLLLKSYIIQLLCRNTDYWIVQSAIVKAKLIERFRTIEDENVLLIPFYPPSSESCFEERIKNSFLYVSSGAPHKNHIRLLHAFAKYYDKQKLGCLHLTVGSECIELCSLITSLQKQDYPIINHGFIERASVVKLYRSTEFLVYPSLSESFGLGIIEGIENGCKILGADRPYLYAVCGPSLVFDPNSIDAICSALTKAVSEIIAPSRQITFNEVSKLLDIIK